MGKKNKEKKKKVKKYALKSGVEERIKQIAQIKAPDVDKNAVREDEQKFETWRPVWRNDWKTISEKRRLKKRHNRPKQPKRKMF